MLEPKYTTGYQIKLQNHFQAPNALSPQEDEKARSWRALEEGEIVTRAGEMTIAE